MEIGSVTNPSFVTAMNNMKKNDNKETQSLFINAMLSANFLVPAIIEPEPVNNVIPEGTSINLYSMKDQDGKSLMVVFTDMDELKKWESVKSKQNIMNNFNDLSAMILNTDANYEGFIINPFNQNVAIRKELIKRIAEHTATANVKMEKISETTDGGLVPANEVRLALIEDLAKLMSTMQEIECAYMMQTVRPGMDKPTLIVVVDFEGNLKSVFDSVAMSANKHLSKGESIGFMPASDAVASQSIVGVEPFYKKA